MKKILLSITSFVFLFLISSCDNDKEEHEMSDKAQKNLEASRGIGNCFDTKDFSKLGDFVATDAVDHAGENGDIIGVEKMKTEFAKMVEGLDNAKSEVIKELADDDYVMAWMRFTGSLKVDMMGMKAGDKYDMAAIELGKYKDGKMIEHWTFMQPADMAKMMESMPPLPPTEDSIGKK